MGLSGFPVVDTVMLYFLFLGSGKEQSEQESDSSRTALQPLAAAPSGGCHWRHARATGKSYRPKSSVTRVRL